MTDDIVQLTFGGSGGMYHYYLGIAKVIQENFHLDNVIFGGTSGGCFPALLLLLDHDIDKVHYDINHKILEETGQYWFGALFSWNAIMRKHILEFLYDNTYERVNNRLYVSMTRLSPMQNEIVSEWDSTEDLIGCIQCSSFIPLAFEAKLWYYHRGAYYIDGGITNNKVHVYPDKPHIYITTDKWRANHYNWVWCYTDITWAEQLYKWGKEDATNHIHELIEGGLRPKETALIHSIELERTD